MAILTVNLETGWPTADEAFVRMRTALRSARSQRIKAIKLIHGYGSSGQGGAIKSRVRRELSEILRRGEIKLVVHGEEFSPFEEEARKALSICPELAKDKDFSQCNHGITVVII